MRRTRKRGAKRRRITRRGKTRRNRHKRLHYVPAKYGGRTPPGGEPMNNGSPNNEELPELHQLVMAGNVDAVDDYLQAAANPIAELNEAENIEHMSPLHRAASNGNLEMVHILLSYGADPNFIVGEGGNETALMYVIASPDGITPDIGAIIEALLTNSQRLDVNGEFVPVDANPNIPNVANHTPLDAIENKIAEEGETEIMTSIRNMLIARGAVHFDEL